MHTDMTRVNAIWQHPLYQQNLKDLIHLEADRIFCRHTPEHFLDVARLAYIFALERGLNCSRELIYFYRASCPFILTESDFILNPKHYFTLTALAAILQICKKLQEKKTFQRIVEKSFSHILLNHKAFNRTAGYGHYRVLYQRHF